MEQLVDSKSTQFVENLEETFKQFVKGMGFTMFVHSVGQLYNKNSNVINAQMENGTLEPNSLFEKVIRFMSALQASKCSYLPIFDQYEALPLVSEKVACQIYLNFYPKTIQKWISFVKDNTFCLKEHSDIKKDYVKLYHKLCCGETMIQEFTEVIGGEDEVKKLPLHPICYVLNGLKNLYG